MPEVRNVYNQTLTSHPEFKTRWIKDQDNKEKAIKLLKAEVSSMKPNVTEESSKKKDESTTENKSLFYFEGNKNVGMRDACESNVMEANCILFPSRQIQLLIIVVCI